MIKVKTPNIDLIDNKFAMKSLNINHHPLYVLNFVI